LLNYSVAAAINLASSSFLASKVASKAALFLGVAKKQTLEELRSFLHNQALRLLYQTQDLSFLRLF
jgi:hypothetical protein